MYSTDEQLRPLFRKAVVRLIPFLCLLYLFNILDRTNVGFARLKMQDDLGMTKAVFDFGYGIFYLGYLAFEVPANLLMRWIGARRWMARIMISWGLVSMLTAAVSGPTGFYAVRILLGVAEAGFFPGIILYLTFWFPARERARMIALFMLGIPISGILGNPMSGSIMYYLNGFGGLHGWQWLFLVEGMPSVLLGIVTLFYLPDGPHDAHWLSADERTALSNRLQSEEASVPHRTTDLLASLSDWRVWMLIIVYVSVAVTSNAYGAYNADILKARFTTSTGPAHLVAHTAAAQLQAPVGAPIGAIAHLATASRVSALDAFRVGTSERDIGLLAALPHICAIVVMTLLSASSDRTGWRRTHVAVAALLGAAGWVMVAATTSPLLGLVGLCVALSGMLAMLPTFWAIPSSFLHGAAAAGGIALINSVANIGGWLGPNILGYTGPWTMAALLAGGAGLILCLRYEGRRA